MIYIVITILIALVAMGAGVFIGILSQRSKIEAEKARVNLIEAAHKEKEESIHKMMEQTLQEKDAYTKRLLDQQEAHHHEAITAMEARFDETIAKLREQLGNVTEKMLKERQTEFEASSKASIQNVMTPLQESIKSMKEAVEVNTSRHTELGGTLDANIKNLLRHSEETRRSADRLSNALKNNREQGKWGETILTELLESNGLTEGIHFELQAQLRDEHGNIIKNELGTGMKPDVILHLDNERDVIIDSKVSLSAYLDYVNADNDADRERFLKEHVASLQRHIKELVNKDYSAYIHPSKQSMGYVIMFVPSTAALYAATGAAPDLWRKAMEQNVYIADEQTLYAALKIVALTWRQIDQANNHRQVFELANEMLKRVGMFMEKFTSIGKALDNARKAYDESYAKLDTSGQSIPQTCNKLIKLGATPQQRKNVPDRLLGIGTDE